MIFSLKSLSQKLNNSHSKYFLMSSNIVLFRGSYQELVDLIKEQSGLVIIDFFATWCGACKRLKMQLPKLSTEFEKATIVRVDIDHNEQVAKNFKVINIPQLTIIRNEGNTLNELDTIIGFDLEKIRKGISYHYK